MGWRQAILLRQQNASAFSQTAYMNGTPSSADLPQCSAGKAADLPQGEGGRHGCGDGALLAPVQALQAAQNALCILPPALIAAITALLTRSDSEEWLSIQDHKSMLASWPAMGPAAQCGAGAPCPSSL